MAIILTEEEKGWIQKQKQIDDLNKDIEAIKAQREADVSAKEQELIDIKAQADTAILEKENEINVLNAGIK